MKIKLLFISILYYTHLSIYIYFFPIFYYILYLFYTICIWKSLLRKHFTYDMLCIVSKITFLKIIPFLANILWNVCFYNIFLGKY